MDDYDLVNAIHQMALDLKIQRCVSQEIRVVKKTKRTKSKQGSSINILSNKAKDYSSVAINLRQEKEEEGLNKLISCEAYLISDNRQISSKDKETARWKWSEFQLQEYYCKKFNITIEQLHQIDWYSLRIARGNLTSGAHTFSIKYAIDWLPTGSRMALQGDMVTECINCGSFEDADHLLRCKKRPEKINALVQRFSKMLEECNTEPRLKEILVSYVDDWLNNWRKKKKPIDLEFQEAVRAQENIGWKYFIRGIWSNEWRLSQEKYNDSRKVTNDKWASKIMTWLIETSFEIWKERNENIHDTSAPLLNR